MVTVVSLESLALSELERMSMADMETVCNECSIWTSESELIG